MQEKLVYSLWVNFKAIVNSGSVNFDMWHFPCDMSHVKVDTAHLSIILVLLWAPRMSIIFFWFLWFLFNFSNEGRICNNNANIWQSQHLVRSTQLCKSKNYIYQNISGMRRPRGKCNILKYWSGSADSGFVFKLGMLSKKIP